MSQPLALIGAATCEVIGISPMGFAETMEANWARHMVFDSEPYYQPVGGGEHRETLHLACRPHVMGGLDNYRALQRACRERRPVPFIRMSGLVGGYQGLVAVETVSKEEQRIAPDGMGWRWEFTVELLYVGETAGGVF
ncbi:phage tail protein [Methylocystis sp. WRRC1]|uniref:phage tail protein n=1 Tax=unclassified Methylocystis TaxID=2625913 RepID=UPI0001F8788E|nr:MULTISPECIES: phage tail protein [unclassified Methylocystis]MCC3246123.1 phage tail protein [Methylocystis sp. WRRC1]